MHFVTWSFVFSSLGGDGWEANSGTCPQQIHRVSGLCLPDQDRIMPSHDHNEWRRPKVIIYGHSRSHVCSHVWPYEWRSNTHSYKNGRRALRVVIFSCTWSYSHSVKDENWSCRMLIRNTCAVLFFLSGITYIMWMRTTQASTRREPPSTRPRSSRAWSTCTRRGSSTETWSLRMSCSTTRVQRPSHSHK